MSTSNFEDSDDDQGFDVEDPVEVEDLSEQESGILPAFSRVGFIVKKASVRTQLEDNHKGMVEGPDNKWKVKRLVLEAQIGPLGVDGSGKYKNKVLFPELVLAMNKKEFPDDFKGDWWDKQARFPTKQFFNALGIPLQGIVVNDAFLGGLQGCGFVADIVRKEDRRKDSSGKYVGTGDFKNDLANFRSAEVESE